MTKKLTRAEWDAEIRAERLHKIKGLRDQYEGAPDDATPEEIMKIEMLRVALDPLEIDNVDREGFDGLQHAVADQAALYLQVAYDAIIERGRNSFVLASAMVAAGSRLAVTSTSEAEAKKMLRFMAEQISPDDKSPTH